MQIYEVKISYLLPVIQLITTEHLACETNNTFACDIQNILLWFVPYNSFACDTLVHIFSGLIPKLSDWCWCMTVIFSYKQCLKPDMEIRLNLCQK